MRFHHIGIACKDLDEVRQWVKQTHQIIEEIGPVYDELEKASFITLRTQDGLLIELISGEPVINILKKGICLYQVCHEVDDLEEAIARMKEAGAVVISAPKPARLFGGRRIAFLNTPIGIVELLENKESIAQ